MGNKEIWVPGLILSFVAVYATYIVMDHDNVEWFVALLSFAYPFFSLFFFEGLTSFISNITNELIKSDLLSVFFGIGVLAEAAILIHERNKLTWTDVKLIGTFVLILGLGVSWMPLLQFGIPAAQEVFDGNPFFYVIGWVLFGGVFLLPVYFRERILTGVNESLVLLWTLLLWYTYLELAPFELAVAAPLAIASAGVLFVNFAKGKISKLASILMYLWYLICVVAVSTLIFLASNHFENGLTPYLALALGMMTAFFAVHIMQILHFHPYFNHEQGEEFKESLRKHAAFLYSKYEHKDQHPYRTLGLIVGFGIVAYLNSIFGVLPLLFIVLSMISFAPYLFDRDRWWDWKLP
ncbi:MAG: hypothetical protein A2756_05335 [Candidatus Ryanbacteria bacterium RIFCSPHIGHO2_01_FULL_48_27]|uniref:Uncharacterized protein n=1 Tax=Candidatus Ryanbacteria bacterium RIFCSPHIGHO2_01_FULL_48_27 TaxID=1802115 RepID=A0A1G2G009_9BACT|nr:MAG: hypothetical protein A2756_05335 [Candidatus Ryanbacteria bacterium RIFCSPHIGHO2_01_FULL_48_27]